MSLLGIIKAGGVLWFVVAGGGFIFSIFFLDADFCSRQRG